MSKFTNPRLASQNLRYLARINTIETSHSQKPLYFCYVSNTPHALRYDLRGRRLVTQPCTNTSQDHPTPSIADTISTCRTLCGRYHINRNADRMAATPPSTTAWLYPPRHLRRRKAICLICSVSHPSPKVDILTARSPSGRTQQSTDQRPEGYSRQHRDRAERRHLDSKTTLLLVLRPSGHATIK